MSSANEVGTVVALAGGVGGAKLAHGLALTGLGERLQMVVNTADDFSLFGLHISPDLDTVMYGLAGLANPETGWGIADDSFNTLKMIEQYGQDTWFWLGDRDFATHILRTEALKSGETLTDVTAQLAAALDIESQLLPMCDEPVATMVETPAGLLEFQEYFVRRQHQDEVLGVQFGGVSAANLTPQIQGALDQAAVVVLCPSNPIVSIDPILSVPGFRQHLRESSGPVVAVSPIVGGKALKGPAAHMLETLGHEISAVGVATLYQDFLDGIVIDDLDAALASRIEELNIAVHVTDTIMKSDADRQRLAQSTLDFASQLALNRSK